MSVSRVTSYVEQIQQINTQIVKLKNQQFDITNKEGNKEQVMHTIVETNYNSIDHIHPRHLIRILQQIDSYIKHHKHEFEFTRWEVETVGVPEPWEDWITYEQQFKIYGVDLRSREEVLNSTEYKAITKLIVELEADKARYEYYIASLLK